MSQAVASDMHTTYQVLILVLVSPFPILFLVEAPGKVLNDDPRTWTSVTHVHSLDGLSGSWILIAA